LGAGWAGYSYADVHRGYGNGEDTTSGVEDEGSELNWVDSVVGPKTSTDTTTGELAGVGDGELGWDRAQWRGRTEAMLKSSRSVKIDGGNGGELDG